MYETVLLDLGVTFPLDRFTADVLRLVGVAPSQLHPNGWAALQAFKVVCAALTLAPSAPVFLSHYTIRVGKKVGWVSLAPLPNTSLFTAYTASYKGFKDRFLKIRALAEGSLCTDGQPMPLYWRLPLKASGTQKSRLSREEKATLQLLDELPRGMNCKEIVALALGKKPVSHLKRMIEDEGVDMAALIKKVKLARRADSAKKSAMPPAGETSTPRAEVQAATVTESASVAVAEVQPAGTESAPVAEAVPASAAARVPATEVQALEESAQAEARLPTSDVMTRGAKRKVEAAAAEEASRKKGKGIASPGLSPINLTEQSKVTITAGPELPSGGLPCFQAPANVKSLWGPNVDLQSWFPPSSIPQYDRRLLVAAGVEGSFEMLEAYHLRSLASLAVSKGLVKRAEQIVLKEALNKKEFEKVAKANHDLRAEVERSKAEAAKLRADREGLWADLAKSKSEAASMGGKAAAAEAEVTQLTQKMTEAEAEAANWKIEAARLKAALALAQQSAETLSKDLDAARSRAASAEAVVAADKETKAKLGTALKAAGAKATALEAEAAASAKERQRLAGRVERLENAIVDQHEAGFEKALQQIALLAPDFDLSPYSVTLEIKDGKLVSLLDSPPR
ncbi:hypothetical protein CR513_34829, partial [Mucuna pruriens]